MKQLAELPNIPLAITIGMFDGVHLGHQLLIRKLKEQGLPTAIITFKPHPREVLRPDLSPPKPITTEKQKKELLEQAGIDYLITLPFTKELASTSYADWLASFPKGSHLILGEGATFGHKRLGTQEAVSEWAKNHDFHVEYTPKLTFHGEIVSSTLVRQALASGDRHKAECLLGYPLTLLEELDV